MSEPLKIGKRVRLHVDGEFDLDDELELSLPNESCDSGSHYIFLSREEVAILRYHLDAVLTDKGGTNERA